MIDASLNLATIGQTNVARFLLPELLRLGKALQESVEKKCRRHGMFIDTIAVDS